MKRVDGWYLANAAKRSSEYILLCNVAENVMLLFSVQYLQVDVTNVVRDSLKVADLDVARVHEGVVLQGRGVGITAVQVSPDVCVSASVCMSVIPLMFPGRQTQLYWLQVLSPLTSAVLAEKTVRVVDDKVSVTELGVQLISGLSLSLQLSPGGNSQAIVATATARETIMQLKQVKPPEN